MITTCILVIPYTILLAFTPKQKISRLRDPEHNSWFEITMPSPQGQSNSSAFLYPELITDTACLNRSKYSSELLRYFGINPHEDDLTTPYNLIIGATTAIGAALSRKYAYKNKPFIAIDGITDIDFSSQQVFPILDQITLGYAFICIQPTGSTHGLEYMTALTDYLQKRNVPFAFAPADEPVEQFLSVALSNGGFCIDVPPHVDSLAFFDQNNPILRVTRECMKHNKSRIYNSLVHSFDSDTLAKFLRKQLKDHNMGRHGVKGSTTVQSREFLSSYLPTCAIEYSDPPMPSIPPPSRFAMIGDELANATAMLHDAFSNITSRKTPYYLSIVVTGRRDNFTNGFDSRVQNFFDQIGYCLEQQPLADIEVVFVDYAPDEDKPMSELIVIPTNLQRRVRFITVPISTHLELVARLGHGVPFLEYIAKNIGIRRSKGEFILTTNPDDLLAPEFFRYIANRQLNEGVLYRAIRWELKNTTTSEQVALAGQAMDNRTRLIELGGKARCQDFINPFVLLNSPEMWASDCYLCSSGDFLLASKKLWYVVGGFPEIAANPTVDSVLVSKFMKLVPGFFMEYMDPLILHQEHTKINIYRPSIPQHQKVLDEYVCNGKSETLGTYSDSANWGLADHTFTHVKL